MKKILSLLLILMFVMTAFISCGKDKNKGPGEEEESGSKSGQVELPTEPENTAGDNIIEF